jgi:hypothetical protein
VRVYDTVVYRGTGRSLHVLCSTVVLQLRLHG